MVVVMETPGTLTGENATLVDISCNLGNASHEAGMNKNSPLFLVPLHYGLSEIIEDYMLTINVNLAPVN